MTRTFEYWPVTFTFDDVLGHGGMGLVLKFNELTKDKDVVRSVAVKRALTEQAEKSLREEGEIMKNFIGAEHLVQLIPEPDPNAKPDPNEPPALKPNGSRKHPRDPDDDVDMNDRPARRPRVEIDSPMLVMEYLKNGNLADIIQRVRERKDVYVPDRILWKFFLCLIKACIELANPPCDTRKVKTQPRQLVHFDIDPQNVLVDDFTKIPGEHDVSPRLKIGDFGLTESMERGANNEYGWFSHYRGRGKYGYFSPEQFTVEWDPIPPDAEDFPHETAGNYGSHTNVWGIGLVMESLITTYYPLDPPRATMLRFANVDYASYGAHLLDAQFDDIDPPLRRLVTCCLAHNPMHRPPLDELQRLAEQRGQNIPGDDWTDDELEAWTTLILYEPPSSTASTPTPTPAPQPSRSRGFKAINI
ncbi:hypothetical protein MGN70_000258 [Eutypa lata]|nr:hypothetical protein MGN70_000258 [Eutypa lata]